MMLTFPLQKAHFTAHKTLIAQSADFEIHAFAYRSGIEALEIKNSQGHLVCCHSWAK
ncbi:hypothetical protein JCM19237_2022 [Photobacterium aphoticum]|uniref:Uncharacterized protein n=1 Tax=Photobacterium aphoticum TaxID=754436 RepID=A0A090QLR5_9GAMM|nr:hypothetical protein JCM19237_2022 [Photobacterium aphoticum]